MLRRITGSILLATLCWAPGCAYFQATPPLDVAAAEMHVADDLPVPEGFDLDKNASWRHERTAYRRLKLVYRAQEYLGEARVREFLTTAYPRAGWEVSFIHGVEDTRMILTKGAEECRLHVFEDFGDRYTELRIDVEPRTTPDGDLVARTASGPETADPVAPAETQVAAPSPTGEKLK